ncbi:hypothetical protein EB796_004050 [Bugula neritina]|uniref:Tyrosine-protein phosphatase domain-containing protein n=1 Tax=Bugula neritina TaxID=10212 RepID=A0A7J7KJ69_BUGNE|nr:hypothetical protein EB796_004050 [Bugula neritina]
MLQKVRDLSAKHTHNAAVSGPNTSKNRWVDILPWLHYQREKYIATQGPLPGTIDHFWRMIFGNRMSP